MAAAIEWFTTMACREATLWVLDTNAGPRRFYEALGWRSTAPGSRSRSEDEPSRRFATAECCECAGGRGVAGVLVNSPALLPVVVGGGGPAASQAPIRPREDLRCRVDGRTCVRYADGVLLSGPRSRSPTSVSDRAARERRRSGPGGGAPWLQIGRRARPGRRGARRAARRRPRRAVDDDSLSDAVLAMQRLRGRLDAPRPGCCRAGMRSGAGSASGAKTGAAWLAWKQRVPIQVARQRLRHARALRTLPAIEEAWAAGDIDRAHVTTLLGARTARTAEVVRRDGPRAAARPRPHARVRRLQAGLRPLGDDRRPRRRRAGRRRRPRGPRGAPVPELRRHVVRAASRSTRSRVTSSTPPCAASSGSCSTPTGPRPRPASTASPTCST